jgi:hypothetical protein
MSPKRLVVATSELCDYYSGSKLALARDVEKARDLGVISAGITATEIPDISELSLFDRFGGSKRSLLGLPANAVNDYFAVVKKYTEFRESQLRYAAYKYYKEQLEKGTLTNYGTSSKGVVDEIHRSLGLEEAAAHLSRNLLGDYGNLPPFADFIR